MENIADRASVEIAAVCTCGRSIAFICSELRSKKKFSEIWETDRNILISWLWCSVKTNTWDYSNKTSLSMSEAQMKDIQYFIKENATL